MRQPITCWLSRVTQQCYSWYSADSMTCPLLELRYLEAWVALKAAGSPAACSCAPLTSFDLSPRAQGAKCDGVRPPALRLFPADISEYLLLAPFTSQCKIHPPVWEGLTRAMSAPQTLWTTAAKKKEKKQRNKREEICMWIVRVWEPWGH